MSKTYEATGMIQEIYEVTVFSETFKKQEFVLKIQDPDSEYVDYVKFQTKNDKCQMLADVNVADDINIKFNLSGRMYDKDGKTSYYTNLDVWKIEKC